MQTRPIVTKIRDYLVELSTGGTDLPPVWGNAGDDESGVVARTEFDPSWPRTLVTEEEVNALLDRFWPFAEILWLMARADGDLTVDESSVALGALRALTGGKVSARHRDDLDERMTAALTKQSEEDRLELICAKLSMDKADSELALALASAVVVADHIITESERDLLHMLAEFLGLPKAAVSKYIEEHEHSMLPPEVAPVRGAG